MKYPRILSSQHFHLIRTVIHSSPTTAPSQFAKDVSTDKSTRTIFVVLPAYNEEVGLGRLLQRLSDVLEPLDSHYQVIVVDDASTDQTADVAEQASLEMPVEVASHRENQGLAGAIKTGLSAAVRLAEPGDVIFSMDADDTHSPAHMRPMLQMIEEGYDVVIASRYQPGARTIGVPGLRRVMPFFAKWMFKCILPIPGVWDYTCGYRAYRCEVLKQAMDHHGDQFFSEKGFSSMVDVLLKMRRFNFIMGEVPMLLRYDRKPGASKMNVARTARQTLQLIFKRRFGK